MQPQKSLRTVLHDTLTLVVGLFAPARPTEREIEDLTLEKLQSFAQYDGTLPYHERAVRALVWEIKYRANARALQLAGEYIAELLLAEAEDTIGRLLVVPVPMHAARRKARGHNQTELLCEAALDAISGESPRKKVRWERGWSLLKSPVHCRTIFSGRFTYDPTALQRIVDTKTQQGLEREERLKNVKNSMAVKNPTEVAGRVCIVVDDVITTGATFAEARRALKAAGASEVRCIALAQS